MYFGRSHSRQLHRAAAMLALGAALTVSLAVSPTAAAQGKDDMWEITTKMEMPGMPMAMPAQTQRQCVAKNAKDDDYIPRRDNCKVTDSKKAGNKLTYQMVCTGRDAMNVTGEVTYGSGSYDGRMQMSGKMEGQDMQMTQTFSGKRVGDCTAAK